MPARAAGAAVGPARRPEWGWSEVQLTDAAGDGLCGRFLAAADAR